MAFFALLGILTSGPASAVTVLPGYQARKLPIPKASEAPNPGYLNGLRKPTTLEFASSGKMFVGDWFGRVKVFDSIDDTSPTLAVDVSTEVHSYTDRGLLGMELDPDFGTPEHNYIYLSYAYDVPLGSAAPPHAEFGDGGDTCNSESPYTDCVVSGRLVRIALDPTTGVATAGAVEPPQDVLVNSWCQQFASHSMGDIEFDSSGALLISGGEGANYSAADYGQYANPCGDPVKEGGSLRAQDVRTPADQTEYSGAIIRVDPATGDALPDNPLYKDPADPSVDNPDVRARRVMAYGFRNPFRFEVRPGTDEVYVGDVGANQWEELNLLTSPPSGGQTALNFGWPCFEGGNGTTSVYNTWKSLADGGNAPPCLPLYAEPSLVTAPFWAYGHGNSAGYLFEDDACNPSPGAAYSGLAFYQAAGISAAQVYAEEDRGALFMADAARGCVWVMRLDGNGQPDPASLANFATSDSESSISPVDLVQGPEGALYAPNFYGDSITQFRYLAGSRPPTAKLTADKVDGAIGGGLTINFDAGASTDPDVEQDPTTDSLHYEWDLDGDGEFDDGTDQATAQRVYTDPVNVVVTVRVKDEYGNAEPASLTIYPGDLGPPAPQTAAPTEALDWAVGDSIHYSGSAADPDGDPVSLRWDFILEHCPEDCHQHPPTTSISASGDLIAPPHEYPSHLRFELTATDSRGRSAATYEQIFPRVVEVDVKSDPAGVPVTFDGETGSNGPFKLIAGGSATVAAPPTADVGGAVYDFSGWSDGGATSHEINPLQSTELVARYIRRESTEIPAAGPPPPPPSGGRSQPKVRLALASKPPGVPLLIGRQKRAAPFELIFAKGAATSLLAPRLIHRAGRTLAFRGWWRGGRRLVRSRRWKLQLTSDARYVAVFARR